MTIDFVPPENAPCVRLAAVLADQPEKLARFGEDERQADVRYYVPGGPDDLQLFEIRQPPNAVTPSHAHSEDEIMYVLEGEIVFGNRAYPAGSAIHIPGITLYSFRAGAEGLRFLNFRPRSDSTYIPKAEFLAARRASVSAGPAPR